jgi:Calx-beta domain-containing protein/thrombospondin type 3 repeat protein
MRTIRRALLFLFLLFSTAFAITNATSLAELSHRLAVANLMSNLTAAPTGPPIGIQFSAAEYIVDEADGSVTITVNRTGDPSAAVSVSYSTSDTAFANQKSDYIMAAGTLNFAPGEMSKSFQVLIIDNAYPQGDHLFSLRLTNPTGAASLGDTSLAGVIITDNDNTSPTTNLLDNAQFFVRMHYYDFLNRLPDPSGGAFWTNEITSCGNDSQCIEVRRINVSAAFFLSVEFQQTDYLVERIYKTSFGEATGRSTLGGTHQLSVPVIRFDEFMSDTQEIGQGVVVGQTGWEQMLENNKQAFMSEFVQRARFTTAFPSTMTPAEFVDELSANAGNPWSPSERDQLVTDLSTNMKTQAQVLRAVVEDADFVQAESNRAFVLMEYFGYLRRNPNDAPDSDHSGYDFWLTKLNQFNGNFINAEMVKAFITSIEYRQRFGPLPDTDGDGLPDDWERQHFGDLNRNGDDDFDQDGLTNGQEYLLGSDPKKPDTDGDGMPDAWEARYGLNLKRNDTHADLDEDGADNITEFLQSRNPAKGAVPDTGGAVNLKVFSPSQ